MSITIHALLPKVRELFGTHGSPEVALGALNAIAVATIRELDMHVAGNGEVVNPAPRPDYRIPEQRNIRYAGQQRRRR